MNKQQIKLIRRPKANDPAIQPSVLTIGNFDGIHLGHQSIIKSVIKTANHYALSPSVLTLTPHPRVFFAQRDHRPELIPTQVSNLRNKATTLCKLGIEQLFIKPFNQQLAKYSPETFIQKVLIEECRMQHLIVGSDFRFGHKRAGDIQYLENAAKHFGFKLTVFNKIINQQDQNTPQDYSSTQLRKYLAFSQLDQFEQATGRRYRISGHVVHGRKLGRGLGFPTLNVRLSPYCALHSGVYIVEVHGLENTSIPAVASLGVRPTIETTGHLLLEVHLLVPQTDVYGRIVDVDFLEFLRDEERFENLDALRTAIAQDVSKAKAYFNEKNRIK